jgi:hypothetical protein
MPIDVNPNSVNLASTYIGKSAERPRPQEQQFDIPARKAASDPANLNIIPSNDALRTQISNALSDARKGIFADRGSILNLLV